MLITDREWDFWRSEVAMKDNYNCIYCRTSTYTVCHTCPDSEDINELLDPYNGDVVCRECIKNRGLKEA